MHPLQSGPVFEDDILYLVYEGFEHKMKIDIVSDTVCPWCFIGKRRLERALLERPNIKLEVHWHPFQLNPEMPLDGMDRQTYLNLKFGGSVNAQAIYGNILAAGTSENLDFNFDGIGRMPNSLLSHRLVYFCQESKQQNLITENLFRSYFFYGLDIGRLENLIQISEESGLNSQKVKEYLSSDADSNLIREQDKKAREIGITGVPCFIINDEFVVSGAQEPKVFLQVFDAAETSTATAAKRPLPALQLVNPPRPAQN